MILERLEEGDRLRGLGADRVTLPARIRRETHIQQNQLPRDLEAAIAELLRFLDPQRREALCRREVTDSIVASAAARKRRGRSRSPDGSSEAARCSRLAAARMSPRASARRPADVRYLDPRNPTSRP